VMLDAECILQGKSDYAVFEKPCVRTPPGTQSIITLIVSYPRT
jgi:hypothetical protein